MSKTISFIILLLTVIIAHSTSLISQPLLKAGRYQGEITIIFNTNTDSSYTNKHGIIFTFIDTGEVNGMKLYPDSGWYNVSESFGGGTYHVKKDSIRLSDLVSHLAIYDWTMILNGYFYAQFRTDSIILIQNDRQLKRYRYINLASVTTGIDAPTVLNPVDYILFQNYPNPFNPTTTIKYEMPKAAYVKLVVYDVLGKEIKVLVDEQKAAGSYIVKFDGSDVPSGVYFYRITFTNSDSKFINDNLNKVNKLLLIK